MDEQTEVIRVPQHNHQDAIEIMNDFTAVTYESIHYQLLITPKEFYFACFFHLQKEGALCMAAHSSINCVLSD